MRLAALLIVVTAGCGGGGHPPPAKPEPEQVEGDMLPPDDNDPAVRASQMVSTPPPPAKGCDAEPFTSDGNAKLASGMPAQALAAFERSIVCVHNPRIEMLAVVAACRAKLYSRATAHLVRVPAASRDSLIQICRPPHM